MAGQVMKQVVGWAKRKNHLANRNTGIQRRHQRRHQHGGIASASENGENRQCGQRNESEQ